MADSNLVKLISRLVGGAGRRADVLLKSIGSPLRDFGLTEKAEAFGARALTPEQRVVKLQEQGKTPPEGSPDPIERTYQLQKGYIQPPSDMPSMDDLINIYKRQGWADEAAIRADIAAGGWKNKIPVLGETSSGGGAGGGSASQDDLIRQLREKPEKAKHFDDRDLNKIWEDMLRGKDAAQAFEDRWKEVANRKYQEMMERAGRLREEVMGSAEARRKEAKEQEAFYKGEYEKRKSRELEEIEKQKGEAETSYVANKDEVVRNFNELNKRFEAQARALGMSATSFVSGETRKILNQFNSNLSQAWLKYKDMVSDLNSAIRETIETYDSKIGELEMKTRQALARIDEELNSEINRIRDMEGAALTAKMEGIAQAMDKADEYRNQIEQAVNASKLRWQEWLAQIQAQMALTAKYAAEDKITSAQKSAEQMLKFLNLAYSVGDKGIGDIKLYRKPNGEIQRFYVVPNPLTGEEEAMYVNENMANVLKLLIQTAPQNIQYRRFLDPYKQALLNMGGQ